MRADLENKLWECGHYRPTPLRVMVYMVATVASAGSSGDTEV
jgi:hypothetical protein